MSQTDAPCQHGGRWLWGLAAIVAVAVLARLAVMGPHFGQFDDRDHYLPLARSLAAGRGFSFLGHPTAYRPPLYSLVLAPLVAVLGDRIAWGVAGLHLALGAGTVLLTASAARRWGLSTGRSLLAAALVACDPVLVAQGRVVMTETLAAFLVAVALAVLAEGNTKGAILGGIWLGLGTLCRPSLLAVAWLWTGAAAVFRPGPWQVRTRRAAALAIATYATLAPWAWRNARLFGEPVWTTTHGGYTLALANNPVYYAEVVNGPRGAVWSGPNQKRWIDEVNDSVRGLNEPQADRRFQALGLKMIVAQPRDFARASLARLGRFWSIAPAGAVYPRWLRIATAVWTIPLWVALGLGLARRSLWLWPQVGAPMVILALSAVHTFYWTDMRMRAPAIPAIALIAAAARFPGLLLSRGAWTTGFDRPRRVEWPLLALPWAPVRSDQSGATSMERPPPTPSVISRHFVALLGTLLLAGPAPAGAAADRPNLVFIMADDLGYGDLGCNGQREILTPNIDRLAAAGTRFTQVYAGAAVCAPSRCVLMTGLHTGHARVRDNHGERETVPAAEEGQKNRIPLEPGDLTMAEFLRSAGYATAIFGKWGLGEPGSTGVPTRQGFDQWLGFLNQDHAVDYYTPYLWEGEHKLAIPANEDGRRGKYVHDFFAERALEFLSQNKNRPFFLYLPFTIPHADYEVPELGPYADKPWSDFEKTYAAMVTRMDGEVGKVLERLRALGLEERTIVFFCSDNGAPGASKKSRFGSGSTFRGQKGTFYEGGIRVPMIVRWPGRVPAGKVSEQVWYFADVFPTAAALAGVPAPSGLDGVSILPTLLGQPQELAGRLLYWENRRGQAARLNDWKAVRPEFGGKLELYDLSTDPDEAHDRASEQPAVVAQLEAAMKSAHVPSPYYPIETAASRTAKRKAAPP